MLNLPLKINQSLESKYPLVVPLADVIDRLGVAPPVDAIGDVAVTEVTIGPLPLPKSISVPMLK